MKLEVVRERLTQASATHGELARIARESEVTYRTLFNVMKGQRKTSEPTIEKLSAYFKKADRRAKA